MKKILLFGGTMLVACAVQATVFSTSWNSGFANGTTIPDGNVTGWSDTRTVTITGLRPGETTTILDVDVNLEITGGYNGDLYGYLVHSSGFAVLLNRVGKTATDGFGYGNAGFDNITLDDDAVTDIHGYGGAGVPSGAWKPDGRAVDPATVLDTDARTALLSSFNNLDGNGTWTLFLADMSGGDVSTMAGWGLDISVVPEPTTWALIILGVIAALAGFVRWQRSVASLRLATTSVKTNQENRIAD